MTTTSTNSNDFEDSFRGLKVLITGHTGFTGSWLSLWLHECGAKVYGIALPPETDPNLYGAAAITDVIDHQITDIRHFSELNKALDVVSPEIVFHLVAQPLVRRSYEKPLETFEINVMGTINVLEACRLNSSVKAVVSITTDKVYQNHNWVWPYRESDELGAADPYSTSKACAELIAASYRTTLLRDNYALATARGGNIVGGGDWSEDRLVPDMVHAIVTGKPLVIRNPKATRPWQHVLAVCHAYMKLGAQLMNNGDRFAEAWNFGPAVTDAVPVERLIELFSAAWTDVPVSIEEATVHEAQALSLDSAKANNVLRWRSPWDVQMTVAKTVEWYKSYYADPQQARQLMLNQINAYRHDVRQSIVEL